MICYSSMDAKKWFLLVQNKIQGPFTESEVLDQLGSSSQIYIWGRGTTNWYSPDDWQKLIQGQSLPQKEPTDDPKRLWQVRDGHVNRRDLTYQQLIDLLKTKTDLSEILIWTEGFENWKDVYSFHKLMDELGVSRRIHPRVPLIATIQCESSHGPFAARAQSISESGLGILDGRSLGIGEKVKLSIKSPHFYSPLHATAEVVYTSMDGYAGLKFISLPLEAKNLIIEYVNQFSPDSQS